jgi:hypothetical protein
VLRLILLAALAATLIGSLLHLPSGLVTALAIVLIVGSLVTQAGKLSCSHCGKNVKLGKSTCHHCGRDVQSWLDRWLASRKNLSD